MLDRFALAQCMATVSVHASPYRSSELRDVEMYITALTSMASVLDGSSIVVRAFRSEPASLEATALTRACIAATWAI